jgi:hypothetical protein
MDLSRRIKLYVFGVVLGGIAAWLIYGKRLSNDAWTPESRVKLRLRTTLIRATPAAQDQLRTLGLDLSALRQALDSAEVDFKASRRTDDSLWYVVDTRADGHDYRYTCAALRDYVIDSTATVIDVRTR